jgi:hypothetical protein
MSGLMRPYRRRSKVFAKACALLVLGQSAAGDAVMAVLLAGLLGHGVYSLPTRAVGHAPPDPLPTRRGAKRVGARFGAGGGAGTAQCATAPKAAPCWERGSAASFPRNKERERHWHRSLQGMCIFLIGNLADKFPENPLNFTDR